MNTNKEELKKALDDYIKFKDIIVEILAIKLNEEEIHIDCTNIYFDGDDLHIDYIIESPDEDNITSNWLSFPYQQYLNYLELKENKKSR